MMDSSNTNLETALLKKQNWALFTFMVLAWGLNWTIMKIGLRFVDPLNLVMQRLALASMVLSPALIWKRRLLPKDGGTWFKMISLALINAAGMASTNIGLLHEASGLSSILTYTQPIFVFCLAIPFLGEKINLTKVLGVILGFLGVTILYASKLSSPIKSSDSIFLLILGAFLWAVSVVYYKKLLSHVDPAIINMVQFPLGSIFLLIATLMLIGVSFSLTPIYIFSLFYMSTFGSAIASTIWLLLIKEEETMIVSTSSLIVPAIALIFGWIFLGETLEFYSLLGFLLIMVGIYLVNKPRL
jgi:drug/metabolite transporter (DMT)-like permease